MTLQPSHDDLVIGGPSTAYDRLLLAAKSALIEVARRRSEDLPGLLEHLHDNVVVVIGGTNRAALGWFQCGGWHHDGRAVDELFLSADFRVGEGPLALAEEVLHTLIHETAHTWNSMNGIKDCSNRGRYHNRRFAEAALQLGLSVTRHRQFGHSTVGLVPCARNEFADLITDLADALTIGRRSRRTLAVAASTEAAGEGVLSNESDDQPKYVFATCRCRTARGNFVTFRIAYGSWQPAVTIWCSGCRSPFIPRVSTNGGQTPDVLARNELHTRRRTSNEEETP